MAMIGPGKKDKMTVARESGVIVYDLVNICSGSTISFVDEGPWLNGVQGNRDTSKPLSGSTQRLVAALSKRDNEGHPVFVSREKIKPILVATSAGAIQLHIPVIDAALEKRIAEWGAYNAEMENKGRQEQASREALVATKADVQAKKAEILDAKKGKAE